MTQGLVFLPGMMCDHRLFAPQIEALQDRVEMFVADISRDDTLESMATRVLNEAPFDTFALAGLSLGGILALEMVRQAGKRIERLALLDTNHLPDTKERRAQRFRQIDRARRGELAAMMMEELKPFYVAPQHMGNPELNAVFMTMATDLGPAVFERQAMALINRQSAQDVLPGFDKPTLVLCGEYDQPCPPERHKQMHALLPESQLVIVPDAGHITTLENPTAVNAALTAWLDQSDEGSRWLAHQTQPQRQ